MRTLAMALLLSLLPYGMVHAEESSPETAPSVSDQPVPASPRETHLPVVFSQADPKWSAAPIGARGTLKDRGCLVTAIATVAFADGLPYDPFSLSQLFRRYGLFLKDGSLKTSLISTVLPGLQIAERFAVRIGTDIVSEINARIARGGYVLVKLLRNGRPHWVLATRALTGDLMIADPNGGMRVSFVSRYGSLHRIKEVMVLSR